MPKECPAGKEVNPKTGRCVNICKPGTGRDPASGKCVKAVAEKKSSPKTTGVVLKPLVFDKDESVWSQLQNKQVIDRFRAVTCLVATSLILLYPYILDNLNKEEGIKDCKACEKRLAKLLDAYITWIVIKQEVSVVQSPEATMFVKLVGQDDSRKTTKVTTFMDHDARQKIEKAAAFALCPLLAR